MGGGDRWACPWNVTGKEGLTLLAANQVAIDGVLVLADDRASFVGRSWLLCCYLRSVSIFSAWEGRYAVETVTGHRKD